MNAQDLFAPVYRAAVRQGIDLAWLEAAQPHVIRWALYDDETRATEADFDIVKARLAARGVEVG